MGRAAAEIMLFEEGDTQAAAGGVSGDASADNAAADDGDVEGPETA